MTPLSLAEKIWDDTIAMSAFDAKEIIATAIREAEEEASSKATQGILDRRYGSYVDGFRAGQEKMREAAAKEIEDWWCDPKEFVKKMADKIRALPIAEGK